MIGAKAGYTGGDGTAPATYYSVTNNDGRTEALRIEFDPAVLPFERLITRFFSDPRYSYRGPARSAQCKIAIWAQDEEQEATARRIGALAAEHVGDTVAENRRRRGDGAAPPVEVLAPRPWYEAEATHQLVGTPDRPDALWEAEYDRLVGYL